MNEFFYVKEGANPNYLCTICRIENTTPIEGSDNLLKTVINGYDIIISKDFKVGDIVAYFPLESCISEKFLSANNLFSKDFYEKNANADEFIRLKNNGDEEGAKKLCGFFAKHCRVRILKLRGCYSQGFICKVDAFVNYRPDLENLVWEKLIGCQFSHLGDEEICTKYIPPVKEIKYYHSQSNKRVKGFDKIIPEQFKFHYDTRMLTEHFDELTPDDIVYITLKLHGTSVGISNILCNKKLTFWEKIKKFLGVKINTTEYDNVYFSRNVIKNQYINPSAPHFYEKDIWGCVNRDFSKYLDEGMTVYGEIVGYIEGTSTFIQQNHDYGCKKGSWKFMPYRITMTDKLGETSEWEIEEVDKWIRNLVAAHEELKEKVMFLTILYNGLLKNMYPEIPIDENWHANVLARMKIEERFGMEKNEPLCVNKVPREGIVIRKKYDIIPRAWKLKCAAHYAKECKEHDSGNINIDDIS